MFRHLSAIFTEVFSGKKTLYNYVIYRVIKKSVHLVITIHKVTSNVQSVPYQSKDIY
jgi:hypothetical protein